MDTIINLTVRDSESLRVTTTYQVKLEGSREVKIFQDKNNNKQYDVGEEVDWISFIAKYGLPSTVRKDMAISFIEHVELLKETVSKMTPDEQRDCGSLRIYVARAYQTGHSMNMHDGQIRSALAFLDPYVASCNDCSNLTFEFSDQSDACVTGGGHR